ncbi:MAG: tRNA (guanosine(46)-N7)-methyltransferase TrmB [Pseudohongiella sp.]|nr:tRNA (guanosine(46)-N7)-methyltransferase TrmB [Pseudohongiella sp.]
MENNITPDAGDTTSADSAAQAPVRRPLRSYVIRSGRQTVAQQEAIEKHWSTYVIEDHLSPLNAEVVFGRHAPLVLEIGFGMGDSLAEMAINNPDKNYIGIEVHRAGVGKLINYIESSKLSNLRIYCFDAVEILAKCIPDHSLDLVQIFFPDPWHKKKHQKRRLIQTAFVQDLLKKLKPGGRIHLATDWQHYAEQMMDVLSGIDLLSNTAGKGQYAQNTGRPETKFERRGNRLGHGVWDLMFELVVPD